MVILKRLIDIDKATKEMTFNLMKIEEKEKLEELAKMTDEELIEALKD